MRVIKAKPRWEAASAGQRVSSIRNGANRDERPAFARGYGVPSMAGGLGSRLWKLEVEHGGRCRYNPTSNIAHQTSEIRPPVQKQGRPVPNQRSGQVERLRTIVPVASKRRVTEAKQKSIYKPVHRRRLQRQTLASVTGAAIIENVKITRPKSKK